MTHNHSVEGHLRVSVEDYDRAIRAFVPHYDELIETGVDFLKKLVREDANILELGCGTGRFTQAILKALPKAKVTALDVDPQTLDHARQRLAADKSRITFLKGSFHDPLPKADAIVASLSLHHIHKAVEKAAVYKGIRSALTPGGVFLCLDAAVSRDPRLQSLTMNDWVRFMVSQGATDSEAKDHLKSWEKEDFYFPLHEELQALEQAAFARPECFWRRGPLAIYGGLA